jgi:hypothetical protein
MPDPAGDAWLGAGHTTPVLGRSCVPYDDGRRVRTFTGGQCAQVCRYRSPLDPGLRQQDGMWNSRSSENAGVSPAVPLTRIVHFALRLAWVFTAGVTYDRSVSG